MAAAPQSIASPTASSGAAATSPTTGTIRATSAVTRNGSATAPHPESPTQASSNSGIGRIASLFRSLAASSQPFRNGPCRWRVTSVCPGPEKRPGTRPGQLIREAKRLGKGPGRCARNRRSVLPRLATAGLPRATAILHCSTWGRRFRLPELPSGGFATQPTRSPPVSGPSETRSVVGTARACLSLASQMGP
jgi:hypothetical protein